MSVFLYKHNQKVQLIEDTSKLSFNDTYVEEMKVKVS